MRTPGFAAFVFFLHGKGPGSAWAASLRKGDLCQLTTPKTSLDFCAMKGPTIFFGDETSIGAARALGSSAYAAEEHRYIFEVSSLTSSQEALNHARLPNATLIQKTCDSGHLAEAERIFLAQARCWNVAQCVFTGCAQSIQQLRKRLWLRGIPLANMIMKPYWAEGKDGLD
jgi:NADPH-dependent ferric siderophore reductase